MTQSSHIQPKGVSGSQGRSLVLARAHLSRNLSRTLPYYLTPEEVHRLIQVVGDGRDRLLLTVLWETGTRVSEAIAMRLGDVGRDGIRVLGKGQAERVVFVRDGLVSSILFYAQEQGMGRADFLLPSRKGDISPCRGLTRSSSTRLRKRTWSGPCTPTCSGAWVCHQLPEL